MEDRSVEADAPSGKPGISSTGKNRMALRPDMLRLLGRLSLLLLLLGGLDMGRYLVWPDVAALKTENPTTTSFMEYRQRQWEDSGRKHRIRHEWVPLGQISRHLVLAVTIAEDDKFWTHQGFDVEGMHEALRRNLGEGRLAAGGSTITQQLVKNLYFTPEKSVLRKLREAILTWRVESNLSKKRILELYLNNIEWGDGIFGIGAAARHYYGKSASALTRQEAAGLAAILPNPLGWKPDSSSRTVQYRKRIILQRMQRRSPGP